MNIAELVKLAVDNGLTIILVAYFLLKDWKFNESILDVLGEMKEVLAELKTWHAREDVQK